MRNVIPVLAAFAIGAFAVGESALGDQVGSGSGASYWAEHSYVYAEVISVNPSPDYGRKIAVRLLGTLSGKFDAGATPEVSIPLLFYDMGMTGPKDRLPKAGDKILTILTENWAGTGGYGPSGRTAYVPGPWHLPIRIVDGFTDTEVAESLKSVQELRKQDETPDKPALPRSGALKAPKYWETHSLLFAEMHGMAWVRGTDTQLTVPLRLKLTLSGAFDCGKTPEVSASVALKDLGPNFKLSSLGSNMLVVLVRTGDSYSISPEQPAFMPDDHAPICTVKDFDDPKVRETLTAVQKLRHATDGTKPKGEPAKQ